MASSSFLATTNGITTARLLACARNSSGSSRQRNRTIGTSSTALLSRNIKLTNQNNHHNLTSSIQHVHKYSQVSSWNVPYRWTTTSSPSLIGNPRMMSTIVPNQTTTTTNSSNEIHNNWKATFMATCLAVAATGSFVLSSSPPAAKNEVVVAAAPAMPAASDSLHAFMLPTMARKLDGNKTSEKTKEEERAAAAAPATAPTVLIPEHAAVLPKVVLKDRFESKGTGEMTSSSTPSYKVSTRALRGGRLYMEDEYFVAEGGRFAAVFDGHGGRGVSGLLRDQLYNKIQRYLNEMHQKELLQEDCDDDSSLASSSTTNTNPHSHPSIASCVKALKSAFDEMDNEVLMDEYLDNQGSTAVSVMIHHSPDGSKTILSGNVGDSRAILSRRGRAIDLTRDHKPNEVQEQKRILAMGETIEWDAYCHVYRVRNLSLSRAIGDKFAKPAVSGDVEIKRFPVSDEKDEFVLLASDGLWDVMTSQEVVNFVKKRLDAEVRLGSEEGRVKEGRMKNMSRYVANEALRRGSGDNICVVIVWLKNGT